MKLSDEPPEASRVRAWLSGYQFWTLVTPALLPGFLAEVRTADGVVESVQLAFGQILSLEEPWVFVSTDTEPTAVDESLRNQRIRIFEQTGQRLTDPDVELGTTERWVTVDELRSSAQLMVDGDLWAMLVSSPGKNGWISVVGHLASIENLALGLATDSEPFIAERDAFLAATSAAMSSPPRPRAEGLPAIQQLLRTVLADDRQIRRALASRRPPDPRELRQDILGDLWQDATLAQSALTGDDTPTATETLTKAVNQLTSLAASASWFDELEPSAIGESILHWTLGEHVPSASTHKLWDELWKTRESKNQLSAAVGKAIGSPVEAPLAAEWSEAWDEWARRSGMLGHEEL